MTWWNPMYGSRDDPPPDDTPDNEPMSEDLRETRPWPEVEETLGRLFKSVSIDETLGMKSDAEIADLLMEHVWAQIDMLSATGALLTQAIDRLRRANAGPLPAAQAEGRPQRGAGEGGK